MFVPVYMQLPNIVLAAHYRVLREAAVIEASLGAPPYLNTLAESCLLFLWLVTAPCYDLVMGMSVTLQPENSKL